MTELQTSNHQAHLNAALVASFTDSESYAIGAASSFTYSGSAGDVTQAVTGLDIDFNTGVNRNGSLQVAVAGSQAWEIDCAGSINKGMVDLNTLGDTLSNSGGLISSSSEANLCDASTEIGAEAFAGGFDQIDELNQLNHVDGIYTIKR